jgi:hypothetical protein
MQRGAGLDVAETEALVPIIAAAIDLQLAAGPFAGT